MRHLAKDRRAGGIHNWLEGLVPDPSIIVREAEIIPGITRGARRISCVQVGKRKQ
jgi:hypothetical protein